ncbi:MAG: acyltransferase [Rhizobiaceae bacterium]
MEKPQTAYRPELDGVRAFCILFTVAGHVPGQSDMINGSVGVDVFFALSGWLITYLLLAERKRNGRIDLGSFYIRRFFRIVPLYLLTILFYFVAASLLAMKTGSPLEVENFQYGFPYFISFNGEYMHHVDGLMFGHSWTLGIEEKFYILWPCALFFLFRGVAAAPVLLLAGIVALIAPAHNFELVIRGYAGLGFGAALAWLVMGRDGLRDWPAWSRVSVLASAALAVAYAGSVLLPHAYAWNILISFFGAFLIAGLWLGRKETWLSRVLALRPIAAAGRLTYAVYLTHVLVINAVAMALGMAGLSLPWPALFLVCYLLALAAGLVLNRLVEAPLIEIGRRLASRRRAPVESAAPLTPETR